MSHKTEDHSLRSTCTTNPDVFIVWVSGKREIQQSCSQLAFPSVVQFFLLCQIDGTQFILFLVFVGPPYALLTVITSTNKMFAEFDYHFVQCRGWEPFTYNYVIHACKHTCSFNWAIVYLLVYLPSITITNFLAYFSSDYFVVRLFGRFFIFCPGIFLWAQISSPNGKLKTLSFYVGEKRLIIN